MDRYIFILRPTDDLKDNILKYLEDNYIKYDSNLTILTQNKYLNLIFIETTDDVYELLKNDSNITYILSHKDIKI